MYMPGREEQAKGEQRPDCGASVRGAQGESRTDHLCGRPGRCLVSVVLGTERSLATLAGAVLGAENRLQ